MKLILAYKDVSTMACHVGLGVTALNLAASLSDAGIPVETWPVFDGFVLRDKLKTRPDVTHIVLLAPWIDTAFLGMLSSQFHRVQFTVTCHSNVGFLQCDAWSVKVIREQMELERDRLNFRISGNSKTYCDWISAAYRRPCAYLPNLHHVQERPAPRVPWCGGILRIGIFGATRVLKNMGTAVASAIVVAETLQTETEIWVSGGREEGGKGIMAACRYMVAGHPYARMVESPWQPWAQFHATVRKMNILLQPSFTESFNNVTSDGVVQGIPSVVSHAIDWAPAKWQADSDDACDLAKTAIRLLRDKRAAGRGLDALEAYNERGLVHWREYLEIPAASRPFFGSRR